MATPTIIPSGFEVVEVLRVMQGQTPRVFAYSYKPQGLPVDPQWAITMYTLNAQGQVLVDGDDAPISCEPLGGDASESDNEVLRIVCEGSDPLRS